MIGACVLAFLAVGSIANVDGVLKPNEVNRKNRLLSQTLTETYNNIVQSYEYNPNQHQKSFTLLSFFFVNFFQYMKRGDPGMTYHKAYEAAMNQTLKNRDLLPYQLGSPAVQLVTKIRNIVLKRILDVENVCPADLDENRCTKNLAKADQGEKMICKDYDKNVKLHELLMKNVDAYNDLKNELIKASKEVRPYQLIYYLVYNEQKFKNTLMKLQEAMNYLFSTKFLCYTF